MSGNEEDKGDNNKVYPLDLVSKLNVKPVGELPKGAPLVMTAQPVRRVLTQTLSANPNSGPSSVTGPTISIVPQAMIKQSIINQSQTQSAALTVARPAQITLATSVVQSQSSGATYHVPRGAAAVANIATPRSAVATAIRASGGIVAAPTGQPATGFVTTVRQVTPSRTPSPATSATWLTSGMQLQNQQIVKNVSNVTPNISNTISTTTISNSTSTITTNLQRISTVVGNSPVARTQIVTRTTQSNIPASATSVSATQPRQAVLHSAIIGQPNQQIHSFKPTASIQTIGSTVTLAQVLPSRTQTLVYSPGNPQHFTARPQIGVTGTINSQRQVTATRPNQVMATRLAVPVSVSQGSTRLTVTPGPGTIYTTGARLSTVPAQTQSTLIGNSSSARINVPNSQQQQAVGRMTVSSAPGTLLTTSQARITVANPTQQPSAVVIGTQAGGRLAASVVSLQTVVVANSSPGTRGLQSQGPKVITQPAQGPAIQIAQVPTVNKLPGTGQQSATVVPVAVTVAAASTTRTINVTPAAIVNQRPVAVTSGTQAIPIAKVFPQGNATPVLRRTTSPVPTNTNQTETQRTPATTSVTTYSLSSGTTYYYDAGSAFSVSGNNLVATARPFLPPSSGSFAAVPQSSGQIRTTGITTTQVHGIMSGQSLQSLPVMVVEQKRTSQFFESGSSTGLLQQSPSSIQQQEHVNPLPSIGKVTSSPRPSILRKRDNESSALKAAKNLAPILSNICAPVSPPSRPHSCDNDNNGNSSGGSTTISATSSPDLGEVCDDSLPLPSTIAPPVPAQVALKLEEVRQEEENRPQEMSSRKKPRKQQLIGNDEPKFNIDDMQFLSENNKVKKEIERENTPLEVQPRNNEVTVKKPQPASLLNSYRQTWKSTHNHYLRYTDVKPKDERRPTIIDLANQSQVLQKINGWKIHHLSTQMEDLSDLETQVYDKLSSMLKLIETKESAGYDKEFNRINELIKGNMQRSKIINDSTIEAKTQVMKIFDHKEHVADIIHRCASKRNFKKREKC